MKNYLFEPFGIQKLSVKYKTFSKITLCSLVFLFSACGNLHSTSQQEMSTAEKMSSQSLSEGFEINFSHLPAKLVPRIDIYEDPLCPYCGELERSDIGQEIHKLTLKGKLDTHYHMADFLDPGSSSGKYSSIVDGLLLAVYQAHMPSMARQKLWLALHTRLYSKNTQPQEGGNDLSQSQLVRIVQEIAHQEKITLPASLLQKLHGELYSAGKDIGATTDAIMSQKNIIGTPDIWHNNTKELDMDNLSVASIDKLVHGS